MPEELDADVTVVDTSGPDEDSNETNDSSSDRDTESSSDSDSDVVQLTDVVGEDGYRKTQDNLEEDLASGNTEDLSPAPQTSQSAVEGSVENINEQAGTDREAPTQRERNRQTFLENISTTTQGERQADVNLSGVADGQGNQLTEQELRQKIQKGETRDLQPGPAARSSDSAIVGSRRNKRRQSSPEPRSSVPGVEPENIVVGSRPDPLDNAARDFVNPNKQVDEDLGFFGEAVLAGQDMMRNSKQFGEQAEDKIPDELDFLGSGAAAYIAGAEQLSQGNAGKAVNTIITPGNQNKLEEKRSEQIRQAVIAAPGDLAGFAVGGFGATGKAVQQEINKIQENDTEGPGIGESVVGGGSRILDDFKENPGGFAAEEIGNEIGETIGTLGVGALIPTITPTVTPEISTPSSLNTGRRVVTGDLGLRARSPDTRINLGDTEFLQRDFIDNPDGEGRIQTVEGFRLTEGGTQVATGGGVRPETPVSRTEFAKERLGLNEAELTDLLPDLNKKRKGQFMSPTRQRNVNTEPDTVTPETDNTPSLDGDNLFKNEGLGFDRKSSSVKTPVNTLIAGISLDQGQGLDQGLGFDQGNDQGFEDVLREETIPETTPENTADRFIDTGFRDPFILDRRSESTTKSNSRSTGTLTFDGSNDDFVFDDFQSQGKPGADLGNQFASSLTAGLFNIQADEDFDEDQTFSGFEIRPLVND